ASAGRAEQGAPTCGKRACRVADYGFFGAPGPSRARRGADVDRQDVVADRRVRAAQHNLPRSVQADRFVADQPRASKTREPAEIDVALLERIMSRDVARQHAGIRRLDITRDERHAYTGHRAHAKALQDMDMRLTPPQKDQV